MSPAPTRGWFAAWRARRRRNTSDPDIATEIQSHFDARVAERTARGESPDEARRSVAARFGSVPDVARATTQARRRAAFRNLQPRIADVRFAIRSLRRTPWYSTAIVGVMGLAMALACAVFAVVDGVLFKPLAYPRASNLYDITAGFQDLPAERDAASIDDIAAWQTAIPDVQFTGSRVQPWMGLGSGVNDDSAGMATIQENFFDVIGVRPLIGGFEPDDFRHASKPTPVLVRYDVWQKRYGGDPHVIGRLIRRDTSDQAAVRIVGVMPPDFVFPSDRWEVSFITPLVPSGTSARVMTGIIARSASADAAQTLKGRIETAMRARARSLPPQGPKPAGWSARGWRMQGPLDRATVEPLSSALGARSRGLFDAAFIAVLVIVGLGGINVSGLMSSRVIDRQHELSLRRALGASGTAIARLVGVEILVLLVAGCALGLALSPPLLALVRSLLPEDLVLFREPALDWRVAAFAAGSSFALAIPTSLWPIWRATRREPIRRAGAERGSTPVASLGRHVVIAGQIAGAFALTIAGALLVSSLLLVYEHGHAIHTDGVVLLEGMVDGPGASMALSPERTARLNAILERLRRTPGVQLTAATGAQVLVGGNWVSWFGRPASAKRLVVDIQPVTGDYFRLMQPELISGRLPTDDELAHDRRVIVVSEGVARAYWPGISPLGQKLTQSNETEPFTVVGVVKDVRWQSWDEDAVSIYGPFNLLSRSPMFTILVQAGTRSGQVIPDAIAAIEAADPQFKVRRAARLDDLFVDSVRPRRFQSWLFGSFATAGLAVVGIGIFGLLSMSAARRTREVGIRQALGATRSDIVRGLIREQLPSVAAGLAAGGITAAWAVSYVASLLYRVTASDVRVWAVALMIITIVAVAGTIAPALRASKADPAQALRAD